MAELSNVEPTREFETAANGARYHVVTDDTLGRGEVVTVAERARKVKPGDVLVATNRPEVFDVYSADEWRDMGVEAGEGVDEEESTKDDGVFHAHLHTAAEVRAYLNDPTVSDEDRERVRDEEVTGPNRKSALS